MPYLNIDFNALKEKSIPQLWEDLSPEYIYSLIREIRKNFLEVLPTLGTDLPESLTETKRYIDTLLPVSGELRLATLHLINYWATTGNVSCHEIMFNGSTHDVPLFGTAKFFTESAALLSAEEKAKLLEFLWKNRDVITNPIYIMYMRSGELGALDSMTAEQLWISLTTKKTGLRRARGDFPYNSIGPRDTIPHNNSYISTHNSMWWITLVMCPGMDLSLDYLIMQDYSNLATLGGKRISAAQEELLSAYLWASADAQKEVLARLSVSHIF